MVNGTGTVALPCSLNWFYWFFRSGRVDILVASMHSTLAAQNRNSRIPHPVESLKYAEKRVYAVFVWRLS